MPLKRVGILDWVVELVVPALEQPYAVARVAKVAAFQI